MNEELIEYNELNEHSNGGTELQTKSIFNGLQKEELEGVQIITSRVRNLDNSKIKIYHLHDLPLDPEAKHLESKESRDRFNKLVFVSNWQYQQYRDYLGVPYDANSTVIPNFIDPLSFVEKPTDKIRLIYTPTPHRGLEILVPVFLALAKNDPDIELHVFSSFNLYGWPERDKPYEPLFKICKEHPQIKYHGTQPYEVVRAAYEQAHIFAYPCIWQETSCRTLIEAMSAGCICIHPNFGALPETSAGLTLMYDGNIEDINQHANMFAHTLKHAIEAAKNNAYERMLGFAKCYIDTTHSTQSVMPRWRMLINSLKADKNQLQ